MSNPEPDWLAIIVGMGIIASLVAVGILALAIVVYLVLGFLFGPLWLLLWIVS